MLTYLELLWPLKVLSNQGDRLKDWGDCGEFFAFGLPAKMRRESRSIHAEFPGRV